LTDVADAAISDKASMLPKIVALYSTIFWVLK
jgi:hypothetical protein